MFRKTFVRIAQFDLLIVQHTGNFYTIFFFPETIRRMKLKLGMHAYDIIRYKSYVFYFQCPTAFFAMAN